MRQTRRSRVEWTIPHCAAADDSTTMRIFFSTGEPSGDLHAANLIRALREHCHGLEAVGLGGREMEAAGCRLQADMTQLAVMWFLRAIGNLHRYWHILSEVDRYFRHHRPDAVVMIDFPGFNWWIARRAKAHGIPVFYYVPPQVWAWARWRVKKMRRLVDHVLCSLPFEADWFNQHGCHATFVGHPFFDEVRRYRLDQTFVQELQNSDGPLVTILPGSRTQEVESNLRYFIKAAHLVRRQVPNVRFTIAAFREKQAEMARSQAEASGLPIDVHVGRTPELIHAADCCMAVSGSVSLELLYHGRPTVVLYWISPFAYRVQSFFRRVKYITLVNLLCTDELFPKDITPYEPTQPDADRVLFPEYLTCRDRSQDIAGHVVRWLADPVERQRVAQALDDLREEVAHGGASRTAANYIARHVTRRRVPRPHFLNRPAAQATSESGVRSRAA